MAKFETSVPDVVDFAYQIVEMDRELMRLRAEVEDLREYRQRYVQLLNESTAHSQHMIGGLLELVLVPGVTDAIAQSNATRAPAANTQEEL